MRETDSDKTANICSYNSNSWWYLRMLYFFNHYISFDKAVAV